jgi:hypothetical protein
MSIPSDFHVQHLEAERYLLTSKKNEYNVQLVDLEEFNGFGECSCEYWQFVIAPQLKQGKRPKKICRHLRLVRHLKQKSLPSQK